jgi:CheY-like chemotaxis protein
MLDKVFSLFAQVDGGAGTSGGGLGIGLFLVRGLVQMHGGTVEARSAGSGQGSSFLVRLPCLPPARARRRGPRREDRTVPGAGRPGRVLVVDDNRDAAETLATLLDMLGLQTRQVHDGMAALAAALEFRPDVVLLDIGLPGMDGYEVAPGAARRAAPRPRDADRADRLGRRDDRRRALAAGFDHHLTKPVDLPRARAPARAHPAPAPVRAAAATPPARGSRPAGRRDRGVDVERAELRRLQHVHRVQRARRDPHRARGRHDVGDLAAGAARVPAALTCRMPLAQ